MQRRRAETKQPGTETEPWSGGDAAKGAAAGAAAGTAAALLTRGPDPVVKAGQTLTVSMDRAVTVKGI